MLYTFQVQDWTITSDLRHWSWWIAPPKRAEPCVPGHMMEDLWRGQRGGRALGLKFQIAPGMIPIPLAHVIGARYWFFHVFPSCFSIYITILALHVPWIWFTMYLLNNSRHRSSRKPSPSNLEEVMGLPFDVTRGWNKEVHPKKLTWTLEKSPSSIGNTPSNGGFSIVLLAFGGVY